MHYFLNNIFLETFISVKRQTDDNLLNSNNKRD